VQLTLSFAARRRSRAFRVYYTTMIERCTPCSCKTVQAGDDVQSIDVLESIRNGCPALRSVFLPDDTWPDFKAWHAEPDSVAAHRSMLLLALERGHLARLTSPIYRYLVEGGGVRPCVRRQYVNDLRERWMHYPEPLERHQKSRIFTGRVTELQCAEWLEARGWVIAGLEASRMGPDIEARNASGALTAFEVKSIGSEDDDFEMILRSMAEGPSGGAVSAYSGINYLLFRVFEAAKQLAQFDGHRVAVAVIDDLTWWRFERPLENHWIDWENPTFLGHDAAWGMFTKEQEGRYPNLKAELSSVVGGIDAAWILRRSYGYEYHLEHELRTGGT